MSLRTRLVLPVIVCTLGVLVGCGGNSTPPVTPPPSGGFSNSNFNGTYTFSITGANGDGIFSMAGSLVACGCSQGTISSGTVDFNDPTIATGAVALASNSSYSVSADGRGSARLLLPSPVNEIDVDFVLISSSHGLITRFDQNGTGSGTIDLQPTALSQSDLTGTPYAFMISGADNSNNSLGTVGAMTLDSSGNITAGIEDFNYGGTPTTKLALTGSVIVGSGTTPGTATVHTAFGSGTFTFDVYAIDADHLKLIENDGKAVLVGDLLSQPSTSFPSGSLIFTMSGLDNTSGLGGLGDLFVTGGLMVSDGTGLITTGSEDVNDAGFVDNGTTTPFSFGGAFTSSGGGRYEMDLSNYVGGSTFAAYPSSGGVLMLEMDTTNPGVTGGIAAIQQSGATVAANQGYGLNMSGEDLVNGVEFDDIAEFKTTTSAIEDGVIDDNDFGNLTTGNFVGTYSLGSNGFGSAILSQGPFGSMFFYSVDDSLSLCISTDGNSAALGSFEIQTTPTNDAHLSVGRAHNLPMAHVLPRTKRTSKANRSTLRKVN